MSALVEKVLYEGSLKEAKYAGKEVIDATEYPASVSLLVSWSIC
jgi:hypothetical protein